MSQCVIKNLPILGKLSKAKPKERKMLLKAASSQLVKSILECIKNVLKGNVSLNRKCIIRLKKHKAVLRSINTRGTKISQKKKAIIQSGGAFLPALLAPVIGVIADRLIRG